MIEQWEWHQAKRALGRAMQRVTDASIKIPLDSIPTDSQLYKARQEYHEALMLVAKLQRQMYRDRKEKKKIKNR